LKVLIVLCLAALLSGCSLVISSDQQFFADDALARPLPDGIYGMHGPRGCLTVDMRWTGGHQVWRVTEPGKTKADEMFGGWIAAPRPGFFIVQASDAKDKKWSYLLARQQADGLLHYVTVEQDDHDWDAFFTRHGFKRGDYSWFHQGPVSKDKALAFFDELAEIIEAGKAKAETMLLGGKCAE
jgi:hypothetical protein